MLIVIMYDMMLFWDGTDTQICKTQGSDTIHL